MPFEPNDHPSCGVGPSSTALQRPSLLELCLVLLACALVIRTVWRTAPSPCLVRPVEPSVQELPKRVRLDDQRLQNGLVTAFDRHHHGRGAAVVMDVHTGRIRATFEHDVAIARDAFPPGGTFKPFTAVALLEHGMADDRSFVCRGFIDVGDRRFECVHGRAHGSLDLRHALATSCVSYFATRGLDVGTDALAAVGRDFGLADAPGLVPDRAYWQRRDPSDFRVAFAIYEAIGQGEVLVTPLALTRAFAAIANGGTLFGSEPGAPSRHVDATTEVLRRIREGLRANVADEDGYSHEVDGLAGTDLAGIPGHGERSRGSTFTPVPIGGHDPIVVIDEWFAGFAPAHDPEIAIVVLTETGASDMPWPPLVAARIAAETMRAMAP